MRLAPTAIIKRYVFVMFMIMNLDSVIDITSMPHSLLSLLNKALALLFITLLSV